MAVHVGGRGPGHAVRSVVAGSLNLTNLFIYSQQFNNAAWGTDSSGTGSAPPVVTADYTTAPDGTLTADRVQLVRDPTTGFSRIRQTSVASLPVGTYTLSIWMKALSGNPTVGIRSSNSGGASTPSTSVMLSSDWRRVPFVVTTTATGTIDLEIMTWNQIAGTSTSADIALWQGQLVAGAVAGPTILTTAVTASVTVERAKMNISPANAAFSVSDLAGTYVQDSSKIRLTRSTVTAENYQNTAPGARVRFNVTLSTFGEVIINLAYTGLVTRNDTYRPDGEIWVDGAANCTFTGPTKATNDPAPLASVPVSLMLEAGTHLVEVLFPISASLDFVGVVIPRSASIASATARVTKKGVLFGDSITQGFVANKPSEMWPFQVAETKSAQMLNHGYGGRQLNAADATTCGAYGCDFGVYLIGFNNFYPNGGSLATFQANYQTAITNWRTASTAAGKATAPLYCITPTWSDSDTGGSGLYVANSPTLEQFRQAIRDAITAVADAHVTLIEGRGAGMPSGTNSFPDGIHPNAAASAAIAGVVSGVVV